MVLGNKCANTRCEGDKIRNEFAGECCIEAPDSNRLLSELTQEMSRLLGVDKNSEEKLLLEFPVASQSLQDYHPFYGGVQNTQADFNWAKLTDVVHVDPAPPRNFGNIDRTLSVWVNEVLDAIEPKDEEVVKKATECITSSRSDRQSFHESLVAMQQERSECQAGVHNESVKAHSLFQESYFKCALQPHLTNQSASALDIWSNAQKEIKALKATAEDFKDEDMVTTINMHVKDVLSQAGFDKEKARQAERFFLRESRSCYLGARKDHQVNMLFVNLLKAGCEKQLQQFMAQLGMIWHKCEPDVRRVMEAYHQMTSARAKMEDGRLGQRVRSTFHPSDPFQFLLEDKALKHEGFEPAYTHVKIHTETTSQAKEFSSSESKSSGSFGIPGVFSLRGEHSSKKEEQKGSSHSFSLTLDFKISRVRIEHEWIPWHALNSNDFVFPGMRKGQWHKPTESPVWWVRTGLVYCKNLTLQMASKDSQFMSRLEESSVKAGGGVRFPLFGYPIGIGASHSSSSKTQASRDSSIGKSITLEFESRGICGYVLRKLSSGPIPKEDGANTKATTKDQRQKRFELVKKLFAKSRADYESASGKEDKSASSKEDKSASGKEDKEAVKGKDDL